MSFRNILLIPGLIALVGWGQAQAQKSYREIAIKGGGTITGVVRLAGDAKLPPPAPTHKDKDWCGVTKPIARLLVNKKRGVKNAIVSIEGVKEGKAFPKGQSYTLDQKGCEYVPHVMVIPFGATLDIINSDPVLHNVHTYEEFETRRTVFNIAQPIKGQRTPIKHTFFKKPGLFLATCDAGHPWMSAYILAADHPYYTVTDEDGNYTIKDIPPGTYRIKMWHEGVKVVRTEMENGIPKSYRFEPAYEVVQDVTIEAGKTRPLDFEFALR